MIDVTDRAALLWYHLTCERFDRNVSGPRGLPRNSYEHRAIQAHAAAARIVAGIGHAHPDDHAWAIDQAARALAIEDADERRYFLRVIEPGYHEVAARLDALLERERPRFLRRGR